MRHCRCFFHTQIVPVIPRTICLEVHHWCGLCHCRCCWVLLFILAYHVSLKQLLAQASRRCCWQLGAGDNSGLSWLTMMASCEALADACSQAYRSYTSNNKQQDGRYHNGTKHINATQTVDKQFHFNPCFQLLAVFLINTGHAYDCMTKPVHVEQVQLLVLCVAIQFT